MRSFSLFPLLLALLLILSACGEKEPSGKGFGAANNTTTVPSTTAAPVDKAYEDIFPYDNAEDRASFDGDVDIVVGDDGYLAQITDWYENFPDYEGKVVEIEGYYMEFSGYTYVGRNGPDGPYNTAEYVNFEFQTDEDISSLKHLSSWIRVTGILREGQTKKTKDSEPEPFCYIEALSVEELTEPGLDPVTD